MNHFLIAMQLFSTVNVNTHTLTHANFAYEYLWIYILMCIVFAAYKLLNILLSFLIILLSVASCWLCSFLVLLRFLVCLSKNFCISYFINQKVTRQFDSFCVCPTQRGWLMMMGYDKEYCSWRTLAPWKWDMLVTLSCMCICVCLCVCGGKSES